MGFQWRIEKRSSLRSWKCIETQVNSVVLTLYKWSVVVHLQACRTGPYTWTVVRHSPSGRDTCQLTTGVSTTMAGMNNWLITTTFPPQQRKESQPDIQIHRNQWRLVGGTIERWAHCNSWNGINGLVSNTKRMKIMFDYIPAITMSQSSNSSSHQPPLKGIHYMDKGRWTALQISGFVSFSHNCCWQVYKIEHTAMQSLLTNIGSRMTHNEELSDFQLGTITGVPHFQQVTLSNFCPARAAQ